MPKTNRLHQLLLTNLMWLLGSLILAWLVWFVAVTQADPVEQRQFRNIPVQIDIDEGLLIANEPTRYTRVNLRAQRSVLNLLTIDDVVVRADLMNMGPGTYTVPLRAEVARSAIADTQPTQITVVLQQVESRQKPVKVLVTHEPPADFAYDELMPEVLQAEVSGAVEQVDSVVQVQGEIDLSEQRNPADFDVTLLPVNADGDVIEAVVVEPRQIRVTANIFQRDDVRQVSISPNILVETLPQGYVLSTISYEPQTIFVSGNPGQLAGIENTFFTEPISLRDRTSDFEIAVPIVLPDESLRVLSGENTIMVAVSISALTTVQQLDGIRIETIGVPPDTEAVVTPSAISVVLNGPISVLSGISARDIQATLDLNGLTAGNYELTPIISIRQGQVTVDSITLLPSAVTVQIQSTLPTPESTAEASSVAPLPGS